MKRTVRTRGGRHAVATAVAKAVKPTVQVSAGVERDAEISRLRRLNSLVRWVANSQAPNRKRKDPPPPASDGGRARILGDDITEREQAERAVRRSRATLGSMIDAVDEMIVMVNADGVILAINRSGVEGFGRQHRDLLGRSLLDLFDPDSAVRLREVIAAVRSNSGRMQVEFHWRDRYLSVTAHPVMNDDGVPAAVCICSRDITDRIHAQEQARELQHQLMRYMRIATMGEMTAALAHELNQPIAAIVNYCNGSLRRLASGEWIADDLVEALNETRAEAKRAREIIRNVSRFVRKAPRKRAVTGIGALVGSVVNLIRKDLERHGIELVVDVANPAVPVNVNVVEIEQTLLNLLRNSVESITDTPGSTSRIELRSRSEGDDLHVSVHDGGCGFSPDEAAHAFDPFFTTKVEGMGMGLAICRTIVEEHGGRIRAEPAGVLSAEDAGIHFTLPISEAPNAAA